MDDEVPPPPTKLSSLESETGREKVQLKYPYLSSEIINCQIPSILDEILNLNNPFLDYLFEFIEQDCILDAVLTNYWRSCIVGLVRRNSNAVLKYIKNKRNILSCLVSHIRDQSIMELVIALGWDPAIEELKELDQVGDWMNEEKLVQKLIDTLSPNHTSDEHSAASYTLVDIVAKTSRSSNLILFNTLSSKEQIYNLMQYMFVDNRSSLLESLSVLLALLHHYPNLRAERQANGDYDDDHNITINSNNTDLYDSNNNNENNDNNYNNNDNNTINSNNVDTLTISTPNEQNKVKSKYNPPLSPSSKSSNMKNYKRLPPVVIAVCDKLPEFKELLKKEPKNAIKLPFVTLEPPLGAVRHKVIDMIVALMRTPSTMVSKKLRELNFIDICINLFFKYPWHNLLHGSVEHIVQMIVSGECPILKATLFEDCNFLDKILTAREESKIHQETKGFRLGFMGHLTRISNTIVEFAKRSKQLNDYMISNNKWINFIENDLRLENEKLNTQLGGHRPQTLADNDTDDFGSFHLDFHLSDINNDDGEHDKLEDNILGDPPNNNDDNDINNNDNNDININNNDNNNINNGDVDVDVDDNNNNNEMTFNKLVEINLGVKFDENNKQIQYSMPQEDFNNLTQALDNKPIMNGNHNNNNNSNHNNNSDTNNNNGNNNDNNNSSVLLFFLFL